MRKHIFLSLILLIHISVLGQDDLTPRVVANQVSIEYGMHPDIVLEMVKVFEADGVSLPKTKKTLETLITKYDNLKPDSKELTKADQKELGVSDKIFNWFKFDFFTSVETKGKLSPAVYSPGGDVRIWYGIGEKAVRGLWRVFEAKEGEIYAQASTIQALQHTSNSWQKKFEKQVKTFKELEKELASRESYDEVAKRAKERLDEGDIDGAEKILEEDVLRYNKNAAYRNFEVGKVKELNLKFREATKYFRWAAELDEDNPLYSLYYGNNLSDTANYDQAIVYFKKSLKSLKGLSNIDSSEFATRYNNLGNAYIWKGEYDRAIIYLQSALSIDTTVLGKNHPKVARDYNNLGTAYESKGEYDRAITYYQSALSIHTTALGKNHPEVARDYHNLSNAYISKGEYDRAITYIQSALSIDTTALGKNHPLVAVRYNNLGSTYSSKGEYDRAITYLQSALSILQKVYGASHHHIAVSYHNLGSAYSHKGEYDRAITYYQSALSIDTTALGKNHPSVARVYYSLGSAYSYKGEYDRAITYYQSALSIFKAFLAPNHPTIFRVKKKLGRSFNGYGMDFYRASLFLKANQQFLLAYQISAEIGDSSFLVICAKNLGSSFKHLGKADSGLVYLEEGIEIAKTLDEKMYKEFEALPNSIRQPPNSPEYVREYTDEAILQRLEFHQAGCLKRLKKRKEAKKIFNRLLIQAKKEKNQVFIEEIKAEMK